MTSLNKHVRSDACSPRAFLPPWLFTLLPDRSALHLRFSLLSSPSHSRQWPQSPPDCLHKKIRAPTNNHRNLHPVAFPHTPSPFHCRISFFPYRYSQRIFCVALLLGFLFPSSPPTPIIPLPTDLLCFSSSLLSLSSPPTSCFFFLPAERQLRAVPRA